MTAPTYRCTHCDAPATYNLRCGDGKLMEQSYSNADGTRSPVALCEEHALDFVGLYAAVGLHVTMEPIEEEL